MSERGDTFIDKCLRGEAAIDEVDDFVDQWHSSESDAGIETFLGMTETEYEQWMRDPDALASIVQSRRENLRQRAS